MDKFIRSTKNGKGERVAVFHSPELGKEYSIGLRDILSKRARYQAAGMLTTELDMAIEVMGVERGHS